MQNYIKHSRTDFHVRNTEVLKNLCSDVRSKLYNKNLNTLFKLHHEIGVDYLVINKFIKSSSNIYNDKFIVFENKFYAVLDLKKNLIN